MTFKRNRKKLATTLQACSCVYGLMDKNSKEIIYVGGTNNFQIRIIHHRWRYTNGPSKEKFKLYKKIESIGGFQNVEPFILEKCDRSDLSEKEEFWTNYFRFVGSDLANQFISNKKNLKPNKFSEKTKNKMRYVKIDKRKVICNNDGIVYENAFVAAEKLNTKSMYILRNARGKRKTAYKNMSFSFV